LYRGGAVRILFTEVYPSEGYPCVGIENLRGATGPLLFLSVGFCFIINRRHSATAAPIIIGIRFI
jgi:hypothetical protein